ncbi:MAG TPA: rhodanese-like domain-containing protein [Thermodesulfovibrionales bacterium]|nr:rhodanese-like domain-containing protein [Thermodesulfovibrionales bacterium]
MKKMLSVPVLACAVVIVMSAFTGKAMAGKPNLMESCRVCHKEAPAQTIRGKIISVSEAFKSFNVTVGPLVWIVKYDDSLKVKEGPKISGPETLKTIKKDHEILVTYKGDESNPMAVQLAVKQPYKLPAEQQISLDELKKLLAAGPEKSRLTLVDSRPPSMFVEGHIPGAVSLPYPKFSELAPKVLPADKNALVVFYCAGET